MAVHVGLQYCGHKKYFGNNGSRGVTLLHAILFNGIRMYITTACLCSRSNRVRIGMESCLLEGNAMNARSNYVTLRRGTHCGGGGECNWVTSIHSQGDPIPTLHYYIIFNHSTIHSIYEPSLSIFRCV